MTILKKDLIALTAQESGMTLVQVRKVLDSAESVVCSAIKDGTSVMLMGLGQLSVRKRAEKKARNLWTGEVVMVPPRRVALFVPSVSIKNAANQ